MKAATWLDWVWYPHGGMALATTIGGGIVWMLVLLVISHWVMRVPAAASPGESWVTPRLRGALGKLALVPPALLALGLLYLAMPVAQPIVLVLRSQARADRVAQGPQEWESWCAERAELFRGYWLMDVGVLARKVLRGEVRVASGTEEGTAIHVRRARECRSAILEVAEDPWKYGAELADAASAVDDAVAGTTAEIEAVESALVEMLCARLNVAGIAIEAVQRTGSMFSSPQVARWRVAPKRPAGRWVAVCHRTVPATARIEQVVLPLVSGSRVDTRSLRLLVTSPEPCDGEARLRIKGLDRPVAVCGVRLRAGSQVASMEFETVDLRVGVAYEVALSLQSDVWHDCGVLLRSDQQGVLVLSDVGARPKSRQRFEERLKCFLEGMKARKRAEVVEKSVGALPTGWEWTSLGMGSGPVVALSDQGVWIGDRRNLADRVGASRRWVGEQNTSAAVVLKHIDGGWSGYLSWHGVQMEWADPAQRPTVYAPIGSGWKSAVSCDLLESMGKTRSPISTTGALPPLVSRRLEGTETTTFLGIDPCDWTLLPVNGPTMETELVFWTEVLRSYAMVHSGVYEKCDDAMASRGLLMRQDIGRIENKAASAAWTIVVYGLLGMTMTGSAGLLLMRRGQRWSLGRPE